MQSKLNSDCVIMRCYIKICGSLGMVTAPCTVAVVTGILSYDCHMQKVKSANHAIKC